MKTGTNTSTQSGTNIGTQSGTNPDTDAASAASPSGPTVVVGVDGSSASQAAVMFAVEEATRRHATLELCHAFDIPVYASDPMGVAYVAIDRDELLASAEAVVQEAVTQVRQIAPDLALRTFVQQGSASSMLVDASKNALMVVVGTKHHSEFVDLVLGSVCHRVVHHASCPVVLVPSPVPVAAN